MLSRVVLIILSSIFLCGVVFYFIDELRLLPLINFARAVERSQMLPFADAALKSRLQIAISDQSTCHHLAARSRVTTALFLFNRSIADDADASRVEARLDQAHRAVVRALACNPLDGNLWFLAGWLGHFRDPNLGIFQEFMTMSMRLAPYEGKVLDKRWGALAPQISKMGLANDPVFLSDLQHLLMHSHPKTAAATLAALHANGGKDIADATFALLPATRQEQVQAFIKPPVLEDRRAKYRTFNLAPLTTTKHDRSP